MVEASNRENKNQIHNMKEMEEEDKEIEDYPYARAHIEILRGNIS